MVETITDILCPVYVLFEDCNCDKCSLPHSFGNVSSQKAFTVSQAMEVADRDAKDLQVAGTLNSAQIHKLHKKICTYDSADGWKGNMHGS